MENKEGSITVDESGSGNINLTAAVPPLAGLTPGRIVHYVMPSGEHRPAMVVKVWDAASGLINVRVFTDGANDYFPIGWDSAHPDWVTSITPDLQGNRIGSWHWIEKA